MPKKLKKELKESKEQKEKQKNIKRLGLILFSYFFVSQAIKFYNKLV